MGYGCEGSWFRSRSVSNEGKAKNNDFKCLKSLAQEALEGTLRSLRPLLGRNPLTVISRTPVGRSCPPIRATCTSRPRSIPAQCRTGADTRNCPRKRNLNTTAPSKTTSSSSLLAALWMLILLTFCTMAPMQEAVTSTWRTHPKTCFPMPSNTHASSSSGHSNCTCVQAAAAKSAHAATTAAADGTAVPWPKAGAHSRTIP